MINIKYTILFIFVFILTFKVLGQDLKINEFMASNSYVISDNYSQFEDWVEIYNSSSEDIDLAGMWMTDNLNNPLKWQIPSGAPILTTIDAGDYLIIWFDNDTLQGPTHTNCGLKRNGEQIGLYDENLNVIDTLTYIEQEKNVSFGRFPDGSDQWHFFDEASPNATNNNSIPYNGFVKGDPLFSIKRGFYDAPQSLVLSQSFTSGEIRYTIDGSTPNNLSTLYTSPISITEDGVIRAAIFQENLIPSEIKTHSYYINYDLVNRQLPVVALSSENENFWDNVLGLFTQTEFLDLEVELNIEFFENDGDSKISTAMGVETHEFDLWEIPQKPLLFHGRDEYGDKSFDYRLFPELNLSSFRNFVFANTKTDWGNTMLKEYLAQEIAPKNYLDQQHQRPASVFFGQEYLGLYFIEAPLDARYFGDQYMLNNDSIDIVFQNGAAIAGTPQQYFELQATMQGTDYSDDDNYNQLLEEIDVTSFMDYMISLLFCGNQNYAIENSFMWKPQGLGKWRLIMKGMDDAFSEMDQTLRAFYTDESGGDENPEWSTLIFRKLLENDSFKQEFLSKYADHLYVTFHPNNTVSRLNNIQNLLAVEMEHQIARWSVVDTSFLLPIYTIEEWNDNVEDINTYFNTRPAILQNDALSYFSEINTTSTLDLTVVDEGDGEIFIHNLFVTEAVWSGQYFNDIPITLTAVPQEGFTFVEWEGVVVDDPTASSITFILTGDLDIQAVFEPNPTFEYDVVINEIKYQTDTIANLGDWVELYNNSEEAINLSGWKLSDGDNFFLFPDNLILSAESFLILASDKLRFVDYYSVSVADVIGNLPFGFSNQGESLTLIDNHEIIKDQVDYQNTNPWPEQPYSSIELIAAYLDNNQGKNWIESQDSTGSPLEINTADRLHLGNIPNQEINVGESFDVISLNEYLFSPNSLLEELTWEVIGNENITVVFDQNLATATLTYTDWQGVEEIVFFVTDTEGQTSSDTSTFLVGTIIENSSVCDETFTVENSPYLVKTALTIPTGCYLHVEAGTTIRFEDQGEILCNGELEMMGTENQHITLMAHQNSWKDIFINQSDDLAKFHYCDVSGATYGTDSTFQNAAIAGYYSELEVINSYFDNNLRSIYTYFGKLLVDSCYFTDTNFGEKVNAQFTDATTLNSFLEFTAGDNDAIDYDATDLGIIRNNTILGGGDDGVDIGQYEGVACNGVVVENNRIFNFADKSVSIGEGSQNININHNLLVGSFYGVSVKDSSTAVIDHCTIDNTQYGVACFQKNLGLGGGIATLTNAIVTNSVSHPVLVDEVSSIETRYTQTNDEMIPGEGNIVSEAFYQDESNQNYFLTIYSPAIDAGDPSMALDEDGSRSDLGTYPFNQAEISNPISDDLLIFPNPVNDQLTFALQLGNKNVTKIQVYSLNGQLVKEEIFAPNYSDIFKNDYYQINVADLGAGYYMVRIVQNDNTVFGKFLVQGN